jgi:hypothetical protein
VFTSLSARVLPTKESEAIWRFPWTYSFLRRTLKVANCCDLAEQSIGHFNSGTYQLVFYLITCCCVVWLWQKHPGSVPGTQTKWASFEASAVGLATREMFAHVCSRKIIGPSHAWGFLAETKVRIQLWSSLNRCPGQSIQRGYNRWGKGHKHPPVQPTIHSMLIMTPCGTTAGQTQPGPTSIPSTGCPWPLSVVRQFLLNKAASTSTLSIRCPLWLCCTWTSPQQHKLITWVSI